MPQGPSQANLDTVIAMVSAKQRTDCEKYMPASEVNHYLANKLRHAGQESVDGALIEFAK